MNVFIKFLCNNEIRIREICALKYLPRPRFVSNFIEFCQEKPQYFKHLKKAFIGEKIDSDCQSQTLERS